MVAVKTGNFVGAGTDAKVFVVLFGEKGETEKLALETSNQLNKFELGQVDEFDLKTKDVGKVQHIIKMILLFWRFESSLYRFSSILFEQSYSIRPNMFFLVCRNIFEII